MIDFKKKEMIPLTNKEIKSYEKQKVCYIREKKFCDDKNKKREYDLYNKVRDHCHTPENFDQLLIIFAIEDIMHLRKFQ